MPTFKHYPVPGDKLDIQKLNWQYLLTKVAGKPRDYANLHAILTFAKTLVFFC
jgi:hypothetical protein